MKPMSDLIIGLFVAGGIRTGDLVFGRLDVVERNDLLLLVYLHEEDGIRSRDPELEQRRVVRVGIQRLELVYPPERAMTKYLLS